MSKWTFRLIGLGVVIALSTALFKTWFLPKEIPPALQKEISIQVNKKPISSIEGKSLDQSPPSLAISQKNKEDQSGDKPPSPPITLISYDNDDKRITTSKTVGRVERPTPTPPIQKEIIEKAKLQPEPKLQSKEKKAVTSETAQNIVEEKLDLEPTPASKTELEPKITEVVSNKITSPSVRGGNWVQAGAFSSQENTRNFVARLKRKSWPVTTEDAVVNGKLVHRVLIGPLSPTDVEEYINILGKMGFNARQVSR